MHCGGNYDTNLRNVTNIFSVLCTFCSGSGWENVYRINCVKYIDSGNVCYVDICELILINVTRLDFDFVDQKGSLTN